MTAIFETTRLLARDYEPEDAEAAFVMYSDPQVMQFIGPTKLSTSVEQQREQLAVVRAKYGAMGAPFGGFAVIEKSTSELVGTGLLKPLPDAQGANTEDIEIGWHLARRFWGRGFATEMGRALATRAFSALPLDALNIVIHPGNVRSVAVAKRLGATFTGMTTRYYGEPLERWVLNANRV